MKDMKKMLAAVMVFAIAFAGVVVMVSDDSDAAVSTGKYDLARDGPLNFDASGMEYSSTAYGNVVLKNHITVTYDSTTKTYVVSGTLAKQDLSNHDSAFYKMWTNNSECFYGLAFYIAATDMTKVKVGNGDEKTVSGPEDCLLYIKEAKVSTVVITGGSSAGTYTIDFSAVTLSESTSSNPTTGYVAIPNANALPANGNASGKDGSNGKWNLTGTTLTLTNYNGSEYFSGSFNEVILVGDNVITLSGVTSALANSSGNMIIKSIDGVGSLTIVLETKAGSQAGDSAGKLSDDGDS